MLEAATVYLLPDGTPCVARLNFQEWRFDHAATGEPLYLMAAGGGGALLRYVYDAAFRGYVVAPSDLHLEDLRRVDGSPEPTAGI